MRSMNTGRKLTKKPRTKQIASRKVKEKAKVAEAMEGARVEVAEDLKRDGNRTKKECMRYSIYRYNDEAMIAS